MGQMMEIHGPITETQRYPLCVSEQEPIGNHRSVLSGALSGSLWDSFSIPFRDHLLAGLVEQHVGTLGGE